MAITAGELARIRRDYALVQAIWTKGLVHEFYRLLYRWRDYRYEKLSWGQKMQIVATPRRRFI
jgi:hypothetical protein